MNHKDEIWVCTDCNIVYRNPELKYDPHSFKCAFSGTPRPYLPSSSVKELVDIIKKAMSDSIPGDLVDVPPSYTERYWFLYKQLKTALKQFEEDPTK